MFRYVFDFSCVLGSFTSTSHVCWQVPVEAKISRLSLLRDQEESQLKKLSDSLQERIRRNAEMAQQHFPEIVQQLDSCAE